MTAFGSFMYFRCMCPGIIRAQELLFIVATHHNLRKTYKKVSSRNGNSLEVVGIMSSFMLLEDEQRPDNGNRSVFCAR